LETVLTNSLNGNIHFPMPMHFEGGLDGAASRRRLG
jgi:hypothetical protein